MQMAIPGFFITGTDTGVGKTAVGAALLFLLREKGINAAPVKPVQTGVAAGQPGDLDIYLETSGLNPPDEELRLMNPYRFRLPASPHLAAEGEGAEVNPERIEQSIKTLSRSYQALVVEGAGGLLVPLTRRENTLDLALSLGLHLVVVARSGLGTINHSLLTLEVAAKAGLSVAAVALNRAENDCPDKNYLKKLEQDNRRVIAELSGVEVWEALPYVPGAGEQAEPTRELAGHLEAAGAGKMIENLSIG
jgi:dethiobiotin synthetase